MANLDRVFHSLSDGTRRAVIAQLASGPASIGDLAQRHHMALPSFMKHIRVLEESEIVISRKRGRVRMCELRSEALTAAQDWLERERRIWGTRLNQLNSFVETLAAKEKTNGIHRNHRGYYFRRHGNQCRQVYGHAVVGICVLHNDNAGDSGRACRARPIHRRQPSHAPQPRSGRSRRHAGKRSVIAAAEREISQADADRILPN